MEDHMLFLPDYHPPNPLDSLLFGVIEDLPDPDYRALRRLSKSDCDKINEAPAKYRWLKDHPEDREETSALTFGRAIHSAILTPEEFARDFCVAPTFGGKGSKAAKKAWEENKGNATAIKREEYEQIERMREALWKHPMARKLFWDWPGMPELTALWTSQIDPSLPPVLCKGRMDRVVTTPSGGKIIVDLKTALSADPLDFPKKSYWQYRYHVQAASYLDGYSDASGEKTEAFVFIAIEKEPPYLVAAYVADPEFLNVGRAHYLKNVKTYAECTLSGEWPGYSTELLPLTNPKKGF
jgi:exodeoxyribonuclease VIII